MIKKNFFRNFLRLFLFICSDLLVGGERVEESLFEQPFIIGNISGGLGNNLFQVAATSALAWDHGAEAIFPELLNREWVYSHVFFRCDAKAPERPVSFVWREPNFTYTPITYRPDMRMEWYFQSEKYFGHHRDRLLQLLAPHPEDLAYMRAQYGWLIDHPEAVGVQLRYYGWEDPSAVAIYAQYGKDYLEKAMSRFAPSTLFIVSSNNKAYAREAIPTWVERVVFLEDEPDYIDLYLLSMCKHTIITNSTFGWWAAWLNQNPDKIVISPSFWIKGFSIEDLCPKEWILIDAEKGSGKHVYHYPEKE